MVIELMPVTENGTNKPITGRDPFSSTPCFSPPCLASLSFRVCYPIWLRR